MGRLSDVFKELAAGGKKAYIGYAMAGFPSKGADLELARAVLAHSDILELGVPFSDPIADGVVLQRCAEKAIRAGGGLARALELAQSLRAGTDKPLVLMSYLNPLLAWGMDSFAHRARIAGIDGVVIPDLPPEEAQVYAAALKGADIDLVYLAAPTSTPQRLRLIAKNASGFIYVVSVAGVTGERSVFDARLQDTIRGLRAVSRVPLAIGFGISSPESARLAAAMADGIVVASTVLKAVLEAPDEASGVKAGALRCAELSRALGGV